MIDDSVNKSEKTVENSASKEILDVNLGFVEKRKFRINGDDSRMLELNVSDLNAVSRLATSYPILKELVEEARTKILAIDGEDDMETLKNAGEVLKEVDAKMRKQIDFIFDTNASEICAPSGNMYDPVGGSWRFEHIISTLSGLYTTGLEKEFSLMKNRVNKKTSKYTKKQRN